MDVYVKTHENKNKIRLGFAQLKYEYTKNGKISSTLYALEEKGIFYDKITEMQSRGLGMKIVKSLVDLMSGTIHLDSVLRKGTPFAIIATHPLSINISKNPSKTSSPVLSQHLNKRLVLAKDNEVNMEIATSILQNLVFW